MVSQDCTHTRTTPNGAYTAGSLRSAASRMDTSRPPRSFADKDEWKEVLKQLQEAGALTYMVANDEIHLPEPEVVSDLDDSD